MGIEFNPNIKPMNKVEEYIKRYQAGESLESFGEIPQTWKDQILLSKNETNTELVAVNNLEEIKNVLESAGKDTYLFTHITAPDVARNIYNTQFKYSLGTGLTGTMTFTGPESAYIQIQKIVSGESPHRNLNGMFVLAIPKKLFKESGADYKISGDSIESYLIENYPSMASGEIPKEFNFGYFDGDNFNYRKN